jgi:signal transduction histidine kinase
VLGQELTGLKLDAGWISRRLVERTEAGDAVVARTQTMIANIDRTIGAVRRISAALRPRVLDDLGLIAAAECFAREISERSSLSVAVTAPDELPLPAPLATAIYRILQELVTNAIRHAEARRIEIGIAVGDGVIELRVLDDGKGIVPCADRTTGPSLGLIGIRERARTFGGALAIGSPPGGGTEATVRIPLDETRR